LALSLVASGLGVVTAAAPASAAVCSAADTATLSLKLADSTCDTINVAAGTFTGPFSVTRSVELRGANADVNPNGGSRGAESTVTSGGDAFFLDAPGITVTINGFRVVPARNSVRQQAVSSSVTVLDNISIGGSGVLLTGTEVAAVARTNRFESSSTGITFTNVGVTSVADGNFISGTTSNSIVFATIAAGTINDNTMENTLAGIDVVSVTGVVTIQSNNLGAVPNAAITVVTAARTVIASNVMAETVSGVTVVAGGPTDVTGNQFGPSKGEAVALIGTATSTVSGNSVASADVGVFVESTTGALTVASNNLGTLTSTAIVAFNNQTATINHNTVNHSDGGIFAVGTAGDTVVNDNTLEDSLWTGVAVISSLTPTVSGNTIVDAGGYGIEVVSANGDATVTGNHVGTTRYDGIAVVDVQRDTTIVGNTIHDATGGFGSSIVNATKADGIFVSLVQRDTTIAGNTIDDASGGSGIVGRKLFGTTSITGNRVNGAVTDGIAISLATGTVSDNYVANANTAHRSEAGGITVDTAASGSGPLSIQSNTVLNSFIGLNLTDVAGPLTANFNRIVDNTGAGISNRSPRSDVINAENNWFGCNAGPGQPGCDSLSPTVPGTIDADPWLTLGISATPPSAFTTSAFTTSITVTADLTKNSNGSDTSSAGHIPDGTPVTFATTLGSVTPTATTTTNGKSSTLLSSPAEGTATVTATVDHQSVSLQVFIAKSPPGSLTYYFAEGTTLRGFREYLLLANAGAVDASVTVTYFFDDGSTPLVTNVAVPAGGRTTLDVVTVVGADRTGVSIGVSSDWPVVAERSIFFERDFSVGTVNGSHSVLGARLPQAAWFFAEGSTLPGFQEYLTLQNPGSVPAQVTIDYGLEGGGADQTVISVPAGQRRTVDVNAEIGNGVVGHSTRVASDQPILAERPMYFLRAVSDDGVVINGGHVAFGSTPSPEWNFAEGNVLPDFANYLTLANPDTANPAIAVITYFFSDGTQAVRAATVAPGSRRTVQVFSTDDPAGVGRNVSDPVSRGVSTNVTTTAPGGLVVERPMYFHRVIQSPGPEINDGHDKAGAPALARVWSFAEGSTLPGFYPFLTILNPGATAATIAITYTPDTGSPIVRTVTAGPTSRLTVQIYGDSAHGGIGGEVVGFGIVVAASTPVLAERPFYVDRQLPGLPDINGGSVVIGFPSS
jgi:hypothetical protein